MAHFLTNIDGEHTSTVVSSKSNINPNISINDDSDEMIHTNEDINEEQHDNYGDRYSMINQQYSSINDQTSSHRMINHGSSAINTNIQISSAYSSAMPLLSTPQTMVDQQSRERNIDPSCLATVDAQPMSTTIFQRQALVSPNETTEQIQGQQTWDPYFLQKFEEFMAMQRVQLAGQLSSGFNPTTVGHNRSVTAMVAPPLQLPSASDLLKETTQQTPASLAATRADQRANNQRKEAKKQLLFVSNAIEHQD
ncbi:unnamed protein product [Rotaria sp. Silwood1]|nr:unnamed protein product [Rotaria sp. Silwood1]CAF3821476.1 unnamed protein product [Rotaria sp. Silwood1]CAF4796913.1 unnamed protein product [Rotaria sp. Silwood1]CAF4822473.1 unnamed protein product [Rotaria sp. Silwood1]